MSIKAIFFDLDGTLLDSAPDFFITMHQLMDEYQLPRLSEADIRATVSEGSKALTRLAFNIDEGDNGFIERQQRLLTIYDSYAGKQCILFPGIEQLLVNIKQANLFWGVITNKPARFTDPILNTLALPSHPNLVICPDHVRHPKPDPEALVLACNKVGCKPEEAIYIGDHKRDIDCGIAAGSLTIAVSFGYTKACDNLETWRADTIAHNSNDIWQFISQQIKTS